MLFHEIYGCYYLCIGKIINLAIDNTLTYEKMLSIIHEYAYEESHMQIISSLKSQKWPFLDKDYHTFLKHHYELPLTTLEKQWLKTICLDKRFQLFSIDLPDFNNIEPLFTQDDYVIYDQYLDGDPYHSQIYQENFRQLLNALHDKRKIEINYNQKKHICIPYKLEYSLKDDKFRLLAYTTQQHSIYNLQKIESVQLLEKYENLTIPEIHQEYFILEIYDERNALERVMTHFSDLQKQAEQIDDNLYKVKIFYQKEDETEMIIRVLSFGPMVKVIEPSSFINIIKQRLLRQKTHNIF